MATASGASATAASALNSKRERKLKRPMNAFLLFNKEMRPKVLESNPHMTVAEISKTIGTSWRNMTDVRKVLVAASV
jgi:hypothetical protein